MLEKIEGAIKNEQSGDTGSIGHTRHWQHWTQKTQNHDKQSTKQKIKKR